ncbi:sensor histidine kinase [Paenibacillus hunanensis]|uniref:sensor histidine kinase n=1 Tax=Paenibacillus hunanensis TaxID=539262 RepID=UPI002A69DCAB|nr:sensor histidine kinase [Paenibacillus hunanensis]WPP40501.1 sensor histidine kinase [Paenibacillus hunanensis]
MRLIRLMSASLRIKLLVLFTVLTTVPLITVGIISYQKSYESIAEYSKAASMLQADELSRNINNLFDDTERLLELSNNPQVIHFLFSQSETYAEAKEILQTFALYRDTYKYDDVMNISFINLYGKGISERKGVFQSNLNPLRNPHFQTLTEHPDMILRIPPSMASDYDHVDGFTYPQDEVISIIATVQQRITHEVIGFIIIDLNASFIKQFDDHIRIGKTGFFSVIDQSGNPIYKLSEDKQKLEELALANLPAAQQTGSNSFVLYPEGKPWFVVFSSSLTTGWKIVGLAPLQEIVSEADRIRQLIIFSVMLSILFVIIIYFFLTYRLTQPIQLLKHKMRLTAEGYLEAKVQPVGNDEISDLGQSFNIMVEKIKQLLNQSILKQQLLQKAELRTLQAQINPHFLYNTLDSIVWMAEAGKSESVIQLVKALSQFFRLSLNKGRDWVTIRTELAHAQSYLIIQQMRYRDILEYHIHIDEELQEYPILNMTLQPLIENAIYHGIKNKRGKGWITISGYEENDAVIVLTVTDNGAGMTPERLELLRHELDHPVQAEDYDSYEGGFGLLNVHQRLRLYFGEEYGVQLSSVASEGTTVSIRIPKHRRAYP